MRRKQMLDWYSISGVEKQRIAHTHDQRELFWLGFVWEKYEVFACREEFKFDFRVQY